ncbi:MAG: DUF5719 family protein [Propionibacteriaceae bacterium]|nr:DUF5719 family protein [Propionibacteriaceae bacterium]
MKRNLITLMALLLAVGAGLALTFLPATPLPRTLEVVPPVTSKLVCAAMGEGGSLFVNGADAIATLGRDDTAASGPTMLEDQETASVIRGGHTLMGGMLVEESDTRAWVPCGEPRSQGTIVLPGAAGTDLIILNPDASEAVVDLNLYGSGGEIVALGARGIAVAPRSSRTIALSVLVEQDGPVAVEYRASRGRATVVARTDTLQTRDAAQSAAPGTEHFLAGIPQDATVATLLIANPGNERAAVEVLAQGMSLAYQPEGGTGVSVPAHSVIAVDLAASLAGEATGLRVTADVDVAVGVSTGDDTDLAFASPVGTAEALGAFGPAGGVLQLSNPGESDAAVTIAVDVIGGEQATTTATIPAGTTLSTPLEPTAPRGQAVSVTSSVALFGAITDTVTGVSVIGLTSTLAPVVEPVDAEIAPTLR